MCKNQFTVLVITSLISFTLAGCAAPGRFGREQYAQLDSDPFLSEGSDATIAATPVVQRSAAITKKQTVESDEDPFVLVADEECLNPAECESRDTPQVVAHKKQSEEGLARFCETPEKTEPPKELMRTVTRADNEFALFVTNKKSQVRHASAEIADMVETATEEVKQSAEESGFWGFPGDRPADSGKGMPAAAVTELTDPFFDGGPTERPHPFGENSPAPAVVPPSDVFGEESDNASWPPDGFEFN
jgi:hypothetical protein